ncbi:MAG: hypothetical protein AAB487_02885 [Patescibacteria group bacterium]
MQSYSLKLKNIFLNLVPILVMIGLIPLIKNDYWLAFIYAVVIIISLAIKYEKKEYIFLLFGFFGMIISEYFFISTGVETFERNSLLGAMPLWLPFLWAYVFVVIKRAIKFLEN